MTKKSLMSADEQYIRFGLCLPADDKSFVDAVLDAFDTQEVLIRKEREAYKAEIAKLTKENREYKQAYFDQWYNNREIERCWATIGGYNRKHLELHEALREYIRNKEWDYEENLHCEPNKTAKKYYAIYSKLVKQNIGFCTNEGASNVLKEEPNCELKEITKEQFYEYTNT
jgi:hypothetical protein